jgi:hypothetical protein
MSVKRGKMSIVRQLLAVYLWLVAIAVAFQFMVSPLYPESVPGTDVWRVLDWFMMVAVVIAVLANFIRKRTADRGDETGVTREYLEANVMFYGTALLTLWFFYNWFDFLMVGTGQTDPNWNLWNIIDALLPLITGVTGCYVWRCKE